GVQFNDYLRNLRIREACEMMEDTEMSINDIAEKCGFSDPYYFSRQFKQVMQMNPQQFKQLRSADQP
ncbi:MAG: helix-turn-helix transcriptional regulator, partial [Lachnospiraceae bacterium]|nr:helix-turn-helix transcriptional regulator [Lachnospiraceae bacterium]